MFDSSDPFQSWVNFCVTLLNVSTVILHSNDLFSFRVFLIKEHSRCFNLQSSRVILQTLSLSLPFTTEIFVISKVAWSKLELSVGALSVTYFFLLFEF